jgi:hypothetical protein
MLPRASLVPASPVEPRLAAPGSLATRNRRTAWVLVAWIVVLMLVSAAVAWLRN